MRFPLACAVVLGAGCAAHSPELKLAHSAVARAPETEFLLEYTGADKDTASEIARVLEENAKRVTIWGAFATPVTVFILPDHAQLESAVNRHNYPWLRAWARYKVIFLQSPRTWGLFGGSKKDVAELLTHELTHCLMYQLSAGESDWAERGIPLWFREGMASYTAEQGYRRPKARELWTFLRDRPGADPVGDADSLYQKESDTVYGAAHRIFEFLVERYGREAVIGIMAQMKTGQAFGPAFAATVGIALEDFESEFAHYISWQGWL